MILIVLEIWKRNSSSKHKNLLPYSSDLAPPKVWSMPTDYISLENNKQVKFEIGIKVPL